MKGAAQFFLDTLVAQPTLGYLVTNPSNSPELPHHSGASVCAGPTMDNQILRDLFNGVRPGQRGARRGRHFRTQVLATRDRLPPMRVGSRGNIQEWLDDWVEPERTHRHVSHLYGLHPSNQITKRGTPQLYDAARRTLELRGDDGTGWSLAWKINFWARMEDGARAHKLDPRPGHDRTGSRRTCSTCTRRSRSTATSAPPPASPRCCCTATTANCTCCPRCRPPGPAGGLPGLRGRGGYTVGATWSAARPTSSSSRPTATAPSRLRARMFTGTPRCRHHRRHDASPSRGWRPTRSSSPCGPATPTA